MAAVTQDYVSGYLGNLSADGTDLHCEGWDAELSNPSLTPPTRNQAATRSVVGRSPV